jgi:hypothetical protein
MQHDERQAIAVLAVVHGAPPRATRLASTS